MTSSDTTPENCHANFLVRENVRNFARQIVCILFFSVKFSYNFFFMRFVFNFSRIAFRFIARIMYSIVRVQLRALNVNAYDEFTNFFGLINPSSRNKRKNVTSHLICI